MRIAIVDDISEERTLLRNRLESQFSRRNVHTDILEYENGETFLTAAKECPFTVVFLDIYMNGSNGIDTAKELRRSDTDCLLIFTTTSTDHALEGFQVRALHYLVKPYSRPEIRLHRLQLLCQGILQSKGLQPAEIQEAEYTERYVRLYTGYITPQKQYSAPGISSMKRHTDSPPY